MPQTAVAASSSLTPGWNTMFCAARCFLACPQRLVVAAERRAAVAADEAGGVEAGDRVALALQHRQAHQRLHAAHEGAARLERVLVVERDAFERLADGSGSGAFIVRHSGRNCGRRGAGRLVTGRARRSVGTPPRRGGAGAKAAPARGSSRTAQAPAIERQHWRPIVRRRRTRRTHDQEIGDERTPKHSPAASASPWCWR